MRRKGGDHHRLGQRDALGRYALAIDETVDLSKGEATGTFVLTATSGSIDGTISFAAGNAH